MKHEIIFRTSPMLTEFLFRKVCDQIEDDIPDIDMDRVQASDPDTTMVDLVLAYFFDYKYKAVTQISGWDDENKRPEYAYELKPAFKEEFDDILSDGMCTSDALHDLIMRHEYGFSDNIAMEYKYGEYTEDPGELDEMIDEYLFDKYMEED